MSYYGDKVVVGREAIVTFLSEGTCTLARSLMHPTALPLVLVTPQAPFSTCWSLVVAREGALTEQLHAPAVQTTLAALGLGEVGVACYESQCLVLSCGLWAVAWTPWGGKTYSLKTDPESNPMWAA